MRAALQRCAAAALLLAVAACADRETIVLLEDDSGKTGAVTVTWDDASPVTIDKALSSATLGGDGQVRTSWMTADEVNKQFGEALGMLPDGSVSFTLNFLFGTTSLTEESKPQLGLIFAEIERRGDAVEVVVIGHTDASGSLEYNDKLSIDRAVAVADWLVDQGVDEKILFTAGRGEREPLPGTDADGSDKRNRRVEILVR